MKLSYRNLNARPVIALFLALFVAFLFALEPSLSYATSATDAQQTVDDAFKGVREIVLRDKATLSVEALDKKLHDSLEPLFDFEEMSKSSLGQNWKVATSEQQKEFVSQFSRLLARSYLRKIRQNIETSSIEFLQPMIKGEKVLVRSVIHTETENISADYRMYQKNGRWRIYDVIVENVGLVTNYRSEFNGILRKEGFDGLLKQIASRNKANEA